MRVNQHFGDSNRRGQAINKAVVVTETAALNELESQPLIKMIRAGVVDKWIIARRKKVSNSPYKPIILTDPFESCCAR